MHYRLEGMVPSKKAPITRDRQNPEREMLTTAEVAFYMGIPPATLLYRVANGKVPPPDKIMPRSGQRRWFKDKILRHLRRWEAIDEASEAASDKAANQVANPSHELLYASLLWRKALDERNLYRAKYKDAKRIIDDMIAAGDVPVAIHEMFAKARNDMAYSQYRLNDAAEYRDYCIKRNSKFLEREAFERDTHRADGRYADLEVLLKSAID